MALIKKLVKEDVIDIKARSQVVADYGYSDLYFQLRTYRDGDVERKDGVKQHIQLDKRFAKELVHILIDFISK